MSVQLELSSVASLNDAFLDSIYSDTLTLQEAHRTFTYNALGQRYKDSQFGEHHSRQPLRFPAFEYNNRRQKLLDLGANVCPVGHMDATFDTAGRLFDVEAHENPRRLITEFNPYSIQLVRLTQKLHDVGENTHKSLGATVGDIARGKKTDAHRAIERNVRWQIWPKLFRDLPNTLVIAMDDIIAHRNHNDPAHQAYEASHLLAEFETALCAGSLALELLMSKKRTPTSLRFNQLRAFGKQVTQNVIDEFENQPSIGSFKIIDRVLDQNALLLSDIRCEL